MNDWFGYKAIEECHEQMMQRESGKHEPEQTKRDERVLTKRNPERENRKRFLLEKRKEESKIGVIPAMV